MSKLYSVTFYVYVNDEQALIERAHKEGFSGCDIGADDALRYLLDNNDALDGAEIDDSKCEYLGGSL